MPMTQELKKNPFFNDVYREGEREGRLQGRLEGKREMLRGILDDLALDVPDEVYDLIDGADEETLALIRKAAVHASGVDDFREAMNTPVVRHSR